MGLINYLRDGWGSGSFLKINKKGQAHVKSDSTLVDYELSGSPSVNQVGYTRIAEGESRFEARFFYGLNTEFWLEAESTNGSRVYNANDNGVQLSVPGNAGDKYTAISSRIFYYQPDTVVHAASSIAFNPRIGIREYWGLISFQGGEIKDGYILRNNDGKMEFVKISSTSGSPVWFVHERERWLDPLDGTGASGLNIDFNFNQMLEIEHAWYGGGSAFLKIRYAGKIYIVDIFKGGGEQTKEPIIANPNLAVAYSIEMTRTLGEPQYLSHYGLSVTSDGGKIPTGKPYGVSSGRITAGGGAWTPILSIRCKALFSIDGAALKPNVYGYITALLLSVFTEGRDSEIAFVRDATLTGAVFSDIPDIAGNPITDSMIEYDNTATAITAGTIFEPRALLGDSAITITVAEQDIIAVDALGGTSILTIAARPASGGNAILNASFSWREVY